MLKRALHHPIVVVDHSPPRCLELHVLLADQVAVNRKRLRERHGRSVDLTGRTVPLLSKLLSDLKRLSARLRRLSRPNLLSATLTLHADDGRPL